MSDDNDHGSNSSFDPKRLRLPQQFSYRAGLRPAVTTVPVRKPHKQEWIRVHPDPEMRFGALILDVWEERQSYILDSSL